MAGRRSSVKGAASFRRLLRQLPDSANAELVDFLNRAGPVLAANMRSRLPVLKEPRRDRDAGALRAGIKFKVTPKSLNLKVGLLDTPRGRAKLFYGHILDVGRKAQTVTISRGPRKGARMRIRAFAALRVEAQGMTDFRTQFLPGYRQLMDRILLRAAQGGGDD